MTWSRNCAAVVQRPLPVSTVRAVIPRTPGRPLLCVHCCARTRCCSGAKSDALALREGVFVIATSSVSMCLYSTESRAWGVQQNFPHVWVACHFKGTIVLLTLTSVIEPRLPAGVPPGDPQCLCCPGESCTFHRLLETDALGSSQEWLRGCLYISPGVDF